MRFKAIKWVQLLYVTGLLAAAPSYAVDLNPKEIRGNDKGKPVVILQNRYFTKVMRPEFGFATGRFLNEAYTDTTTMGLRGSLFITEWAGVEAQFSKTNVSDSEDRVALNQLEYRKINSSEIVSPDVEVNPVYSTVDVNGILAPFYGKLNLFDQFIVYSDLYVTAGLTTLETEQGQKTAISLGAGQRFYWKKSLSFRIDFRNRNYNELRSGQTYNKNTQSVDLGVSYFFL